jgi:Methyltransferase domain
MVSARRIIFNVATFIPGITLLPPVKRVLERRSLGTGGTDSGRYCFSVWLRHLIMAATNGLGVHPRTIAELGPGDSLGIGLAALLSGAEQYYAFDVVRHATVRRNLTVLDELIELFRARADVPGDGEFPDVQPPLADYRFPHHILTETRLHSALHPDRIKRIKESITNCEANDSMIKYRAPWFGQEVIEEGSVDLIFSQAVLEHVDNLPEAYRAMRLWLAPQGYLSHEIDLKSHGFAHGWDGHWTYSPLAWTLIRGKDTWLINREPKSTHIRLLETQGFRIACDRTLRIASTVSRAQLAKRFRGLADEDLTAAEVFIQATRSTGAGP